VYKVLKVSDGWILECVECGNRFDSDPKLFFCPKCNSLLQLFATKNFLAEELFDNEFVERRVWRYRRTLPVSLGAEPVTLNEGGTPLVKSVHIADEIGAEKLYVKAEGENPTGSFKDRGMTVAVTRAKESGAKTLVCASTGNTAASLAAYAARSGLKAAVVLPAGKVASGKLVQAYVHGVHLIRVGGNFDKALGMTMDLVSENSELYLVNSVNPYRIEGQKTVSYELFEQLGRTVPDYVVLPVGNAGNISAVWKGFKELQSWGVTQRLPKLIGVQAAGAAPIVEMIVSGRSQIKPWSSPATIASAISIGNPASWKKALAAIKESGGTAIAVSDKEIVQARMDLASKEGLFVENASAAPVAALRRLRRTLDKGSVVVCIATGHGLKDQDTIDWDPKSAPIAEDRKSLAKLISA
jgi:threonine synthase